jgi:undecaprenyl-diphosphatase
MVSDPDSRGRDSLDARIRRAVLAIDDRGLGPQGPLAPVGDGPWHFGLAVIAAAVVARRGGWGRGVPIVLASLAAIATHQTIKRVWRRPRPPGALARGKREPAFPSGHTIGTTAVTLSAAHALAEESLAPRGLALGTAAAISLAIGASRVWRDEHWASDVVAGWAGGVGIAALGGALGDRLARPRARRRRGAAR